MPLESAAQALEQLQQLQEFGAIIPLELQSAFTAYLAAHFQDDAITSAHLPEWCTKFLRDHDPEGPPEPDGPGAGAATDFRVTKELPCHWVNDMLFPLPRALDKYAVDCDTFNNDLLLNQVATGPYAEPRVNKLLDFAQTQLVHRNLPPHTKPVLVDFDKLATHRTAQGLAAPNVMTLFPRNMRGYKEWVSFINPISNGKNPLLEIFDNRCVLMPLPLWHKWMSRYYSKGLFAPIGFMLVVDVLGFWWQYADIIMGTPVLESARAQMFRFLHDLPMGKYLLVLWIVDRPLAVVGQLTKRAVVGTAGRYVDHEGDEKLVVILHNAATLKEEGHLQIPFGTCQRAAQTVYHCNEHVLANCARIKAGYPKEIAMKSGQWYYSGNSFGGTLTAGERTPQLHAIVDAFMTLQPCEDYVPNLGTLRATNFTNDDVIADYKSPEPINFDPFALAPAAPASQGTPSSLTPSGLRTPSLLRSAASARRLPARVRDLPLNFSLFNINDYDGSLDTAERPLPLGRELPDLAINIPARVPHHTEAAMNATQREQVLRGLAPAQAAPELAAPEPAAAPAAVPAARASPIGMRAAIAPGMHAHAAGGLQPAARATAAARAPPHGTAQQHDVAMVQELPQRPPRARSLQSKSSQSHPATPAAAPAAVTDLAVQLAALLGAQQGSTPTSGNRTALSLKRHRPGVGALRHAAALGRQHQQQPRVRVQLPAECSSEWDDEEAEKLHAYAWAPEAEHDENAWPGPMGARPRGGGGGKRGRFAGLQRGGMQQGGHGRPHHGSHGSW